MPSIVTVGTFDRGNIDDVTKILHEFDTEVAPQVAGLRRRQVYTYCDLYVHLQDWDVADEADAHRTITTDPRFQRLEEDLAAHFGECVATPDWDGPTDRPTASGFYLWPAEPLDNLEHLDCIVIVNTQRHEHIPEVSRLFADLDATDFPHKMGTLRRQIFLQRGIYLHIQDFRADGSHEAIGSAWKEADPRFLKIVDDLTPIVPPYNPAENSLATRFYHWAATS
ncbi:TcmI family type II polyketide cyclase [Streptosporangiaceae bacterium NEAU-GS5]|nr:TcmI family type II polyketide cyclase [Streptosporangiaceae bacterium NEAU-GS5]